MSMEENPYAAPRSPITSPVGVRGGRQEDVRKVAVYQKGIIVCILIYFVGIGILFAFVAAGLQPPSIVSNALGFLLIGNALAGVVLVVLLAIKVYHPALGVLMVILTMVPCWGVLMLLLISVKATSILRKNGYKVGFFGANLAEIPK
jgi:hypothetical protein